MVGVQYLNGVGLLLTVIGAGVSASGVIMSQKTATDIATPRWDFSPELCASLLKQSYRAAIGLGIIAGGAALQLIALFAG
jgi:hypothetical protein